MARAKAPFRKSILRVRGLIGLHRYLHGQRGRPRQSVSDVLRGAIVLAVGALDGLVLEAVTETVAPAARVPGGPGPTVSKWVKDDPERFLALLASADPPTGMATLARDNLGSRTFQKSEAIEAVMRDVGKCDPPWDRAAKRLSRSGATWTADAVQARLDEFVKRRDAIVHSGDLQRGRRATTIKISYVVEAADVIEAVGLAICESVDLRVRQLARVARGAP